jgi:prefoldin subunit 5
MNAFDRLWKALSDVIKMNDKVERLASNVAELQEDNEKLTERIIRVEARLDTIMDIATARRSLPPEM